MTTASKKKAATPGHAATGVAATGPAAILMPRRPERARHPWVFEGEIASLPDEIQDGQPVRVLDHRRRFFAMAYCNRRSKIVLRLLSRIDEPIDAAWWKRAIAASVTRRGDLAPHDGVRLVNAEGDRLPGVVVDRYAGWLSIQLSTLGADAVRSAIVEALITACSPVGIFERSDVPERALEGIEPKIGPLAGGEPPETVEIREGDARLLVDIVRGQKTGLFLDQRVNRRAAAAYAKDRRVLNCFAYSGGFSVHAALAGAMAVTSVDISGPACALALRNMTLNGFADADVVEANCFDWLRHADDSGERFGMAILDPPAFARGKSTIDSALRGYKEINLRAIRTLEPGGILVTCSCSRPIGLDDFVGVVKAASDDAGRDIQLLEERTQPPDHPVLLDAPETSYLKCLIVRAL
ncbi:MAG TPA: class I SAM-dependent rRNA methyltransferase [Candidatus Eremiobacteraceae bacterium]